MLLNEINFTFPEDKEVDGIIVKQYISIADKMEIIGNIVNNSIDVNQYYNPTRLHIYYVLNMVKAYTNIEYNDTDEIFMVYDNLIGSGLWDKINEKIPEEETDFILDSVNKVIENVYSYRNSMAGILESLQNNYTNTIQDGEELQKIIADPNNLSLLKQIIEKLG